MQTNVLNAAMKYGLIMGIVFSVNFLLSVSGNAIITLLGYLVVAFIFVLTYRFAVAYRDKENGGSISFGHAFFFIILLFLFAAIISSLFKFIYFKYLNVNYLPMLLEQSVSMMQQLQEQFHLSVPDDYYETMDKMMSPTAFTLQYIWVNTFLGVIMGLIIAPFVKKDKDIFNNPEN
ncbi:MAG TPA: DUF4199 domain-containing protein [Paludibacteraceae bacterium]|nr:DUF4199 domain-containing protein [Paludibacteraceae bacterium]HPT43693.1 DUF4199 domain-containing protein [Paludibacteraceae bacterium]